MIKFLFLGHQETNLEESLNAIFALMTLIENSDSPKNKFYPYELLTSQISHLHTGEIFD